MNRAGKVQSEAGGARIESEIDRILASEEELTPSSGFAASVMEQVRQEAALPAPLPFPWKWAVPVLLLAAAACGWGAAELIRLGLPGAGNFGLSLPDLNSLTGWLTLIPLPHLSASLVGPVEQAAWVALALGSPLLSWLISRRLAGSGGLL